MKSLAITLLIVGGVALTGCGGGGGGSSSKPATTPPTSTAAITSSSSSSSLLSSSSLSSSSVISSSSSSSSVKREPIMTEKTSYLNKVKMGDPNHGKAYSMQAIDGPSKGHNHRLIVYGDFFQDGTISALAISNMDNSMKSAIDWQAGTLRFFHRTADGDGWIDRTAELLKDNTGCMTLRKGNVADFNEDGKPDIYFGCHGADTVDAVGEYQRVLLSQADGTYTNNIIPILCYCHASTAGDMNGDGHIDILTFDNLAEDKVPGHHMGAIALMGNGDGTFTNNPEYAPKPLDQKGVYTLDLIDSGRGMLDLFVGGNSTPPELEWWKDDFANSVLHNDGDGKYTSKPIVLDNTPGKTFYNLALDFIVKDGFVYMDQIGDDYKASAVRRVDLADPTQSVLLYEYVSVRPDTWYPWITLVDGKRIATMCDYSNIEHSWCHWEEPTI